MTKYREILRLQSLGFSERNIAQSCGVSRNTVAKVLKKAAEINISWPLDFDMTDSALEELMFPKCIFRKNCASVPEERSAIPLQAEQSSAG